jgi:hypothetical protein
VAFFRNVLSDDFVVGTGSVSCLHFGFVDKEENKSGSRGLVVAVVIVGVNVRGGGGL